MLHMRAMLHMQATLHIGAMLHIWVMLHIPAMLHIRVTLHIRAMVHVPYAGDVTYESFLLLLFLEDNGIVFFCLLTISSGKSIVFDNSDHIKCLLIGTCRPYTVTYVGDATHVGFFWSLSLETMELFL